MIYLLSLALPVELVRDWRAKSVGQGQSPTQEAKAPG